MFSHQCLQCNVVFENKYKNAKFCSRICLFDSGVFSSFGKKWKLTSEQIEARKIRQLGQKNNNFRHGKTPQLYNLVSKVPEHRIVMEQALGRPLKDVEVVHHWDENKKNNELDNLCLLRSKSAHTKLHNFARRHNIKVEALKFKQNWLYA